MRKLVFACALFAAACNGEKVPQSAGTDQRVVVQPPGRLASLVASYEMSRLQDGNIAFHECHPDPDSNGCVDEMCKHLDNWECDDQSELLPIIKACKGNYGGACVKEACTHLDNWECDDQSEVLPIAESCRGIDTASCLASACKRLDNWDCDDQSEVLPILDACQAGHVDGGCIDAVCAQLDSWECDDWSELEDIIQACGD